MNPLHTLARLLTVRDAPVDIVRRVHAILSDHGADIPVALWDGTALGPTDTGYRFVLRHPWSLRSILVPPTDVAAGEAYLFDDVDVEGCMITARHAIAAFRGDVDLGWGTRVHLFRLLLSLPLPPKRGRNGRAQLRGRRHTKQRDQQAVQFHYDVSNAFYGMFLGEQLVYSCAYFSDEDPGEPREDPRALERAQVRKLDMVCRKLRLSEGQRLLDIGCGWGALVLHAARHYGVCAEGITLSVEQAALARKRIAQAGLDDRVEVRVEDYRDTTGRYDAVASIGMFEHVGEPQFSNYFARAYELTAPGGLFLNHAITTGRHTDIRDLSADSRVFVGAYVFPDATLAPANLAVRLMEESGFELLDVHQLRLHYARTLRHWVFNLERNAGAARAEVGEVVYRIWRAYMAGAAVGFATADLGVVQVLGAKDPQDLPLGRRWMEPTRP